MKISSKLVVIFKYKGVLSDYFQSDVGLMQGETLSPLLFSLYVNNLDIHFVKDSCPSLEIQEVSLFFLMYAYDIVLFSEGQEGLQHILNILSEYSAIWNLNVNT